MKKKSNELLADLNVAEQKSIIGGRSPLFFPIAPFPGPTFPVIRPIITLF